MIKLLPFGLDRKLKALITPQKALTIQNYIFFFRNKLKAISKARKQVPLLLNVNAVNELNYRKRALFIWRDTPFLVPEDDPEFLRHQNLRQCRQIAALLGELGYVVDVSDVKDKKFRPSGHYDLIINTKPELKYGKSVSQNQAIKIFLALALNNSAHNKNLRRRHKLLYERRKSRLMYRKIFNEKMPYVAISDALICFGNESIMSTWKDAFKGPSYPFNNYGFKETKFIFESKNFKTARKNFLYFASRTQMQKGLDLLLEVFPKHPSLNLFICSYYKLERDFCACYYKELFETSNVHPMGWISVNSPEYCDLIEKCAYVILPSCAEGSAGSVVQCMYSGLIPLVTKEAGIDTEDFGVTFADDSLEEIERVIIEVSEKPETWHREHSIRTHEVSVKKYSEDAFINRWRDMLAEILNSTR